MDNNIPNYPDTDQQSTQDNSVDLKSYYTPFGPGWGPHDPYCRCYRCPCCGKPIRQYGYPRYPWQWNDPYITWGTSSQP